jgi:hypothetical protein
MGHIVNLTKKCIFTAMKRCFAFLLLIIYSVTSIGATVQLHYCMGKLSGWSISLTESNSKECSKCGMEKAHSDKGCCHDENKLLKIQDDQKANYVSLDILKLSVSAAVSVDQSVACLLLQKKQLPSKSNAPPLIGDLDLCIRNCVFRI